MWRSGTRLGKRGGGGLKVELESESFYVISEVFSDPNFVSANVRRCARAVPRPPVRPTAPSTPCSPRVPPPRHPLRSVARCPRPGAGGPDCKSRQAAGGRRGQWLSRGGAARLCLRRRPVPRRREPRSGRAAPAPQPGSEPPARPGPPRRAPPPSMRFFRLTFKCFVDCF